MGLRPARAIRAAQGQIWARTSQKKPRKCYVKGAPRPKVRQYNMGADQYFEIQADLVAESPIHLRDNAIEAGRQAANKYLEKKLFTAFAFKVLKYPHYVIREHSALGVAGADRISKGMKKAFGKPKGRMCLVDKGDSIFRVWAFAKDLPAVKAALKRARLKMSGSYSVAVTDISKEDWNLEKKGKEVKVFKKTAAELEAEKTADEAKATAAAAKAVEGTAKEGAPAEAKSEESRKEKK